jgi:transcriptional antiterminator RfaH
MCAGGPATVRRVEAAWYCARTKPKHEHIAAAGLARRLGLEVFHPRMRSERATRRGVVRIVEPLFPCYVFVRCAAADGLDEVRYMSGVSGLVQFGQRVATVPDHVIDELRQCFESGNPMWVEDRMCAGAEVTVAEGSFLGSQGIVVRVLSAKQRVQILLDFLGRPTLAEVDRKSLTLDERRMADLVPALARTQQECVRVAA